jgi:mercuric ion transport protein
MKEKTKQIIGTAITAACCLGLPIVLGALSAIGLEFLIHDAILIPLFIGFISFNECLAWQTDYVRIFGEQEACCNHS